MIATSLRIAGALALTVSVAACGNDKKQDSSAFTIASQAVGALAADRKARNAPKAPPVSPAAMASEALSVNKGPLILVGLESSGTNQVLAMTGDNRGMRTYMTKNEQALILRNGILVGTRGLGNDLSVAEAAGSANLILSGRGGQAERTMRLYAGDGLERPLNFTCSIGAGPKPGVILENCSGHGASFQNSYIVSGGRATVSRQWVSPALGYVTIQELRY
ncbi:YjbF family lipoprotein [Paracoccus aminophilus]|uniref:Lipoprotein n=1 Tax=Paracoccus aminophilus JCM 7686 TaxID=1367847 RepID=S5XKE4_PARAH|nr:YjbF family lipoprotein [Paracoccus aminophilus]AGT07679.1 hypothetical protein JCM7686_0570 [Paracoccus aminophilus JCM 7686]